ncbi:MAG: rod shape-determining protein MreD [Alphaproteobacteria bacterium RIFOXYD12_FULL_60_8]|nr:MAG: rod shape-determining protein MreD [Alphaproteobacteria bacterium RIFOXYD12_FULL_60_8]
MSADPNLWQRLDMTARNLMPSGLTLFLAIASVAPTRIPGFVGISPMLALMGIYYWSMTRPDLLRASVAFGIGLFVDILTGTPLGVHVLVFLLTHGLLVRQNRFFNNKPFHVLWLAFGVVAAGAGLLKWGLVAFLQTGAVDPHVFFFGYIMTVAVYPLAGWMFARLQLVVLKEE